MTPEANRRPSLHLGRRLAVLVVMLVFWLVFSGHYDAFHLGLGLVCSALVSLFSYDLLVSGTGGPHVWTKAWRVLPYAPWLLYQIVLANLHVVYLVLFPDRIRPRIVRFKTSLTSEIARVTLGNSITLTPGTITMDIVDGEFYVHALSERVARDLLSREMEARVAAVFLEPQPESTGPGGEDKA